MQPTVLHIFVSSTWMDLQPERAAVETALQRLRETKFVGMEYFGSRGEDTRRTSLDEVDRSQVYVGIFGGRYGSGITEAEYRRARELGLPCFIYLKDEATIPPEGCETDPEKAARLAALKAELLEHHTISTFTAPDDLAARVTADLHRWLFDEYLRPPLGIPFQAPTVPRYFVPRPEVSQALMDYLTADVPPGALVVSAVHGLGGIGKTTLVAALAHDPDVQARFPDGVLWATLGQHPDVLSLLVGWIQALGDYNFRPTVVESASAHLRTLLHDKACLLAVDDAWQADHVRPFLLGGPRCRLVITTRNAALARKVGARLYDLDVMTEAQALALFQTRLGPLNGDCKQAAALAGELGYLPLALELAAAQVEAGLSWTELVDAFRQGLADLATLDLDEATYRNESLRLSFRLSLEKLSPDDQNAFVGMGVLPEDGRLNPAMAATLWNEAEREARKRLRRLRDKALLKEIGKDRYTLHDLLHDEAKLRLTEQMALPQAHARLLDRYRRTVTYDRWDRLPDDGYIHTHLTWHMEQAGQPEAIHALLRLETQEERNAWYQAREALGQIAGYLKDVRRGWRLAEEEFAIRHSPLAIGLQCRYALVVASISSLAKNILPALLIALVQKGIWPLACGLAYAHSLPEAGRRSEALAGLANYLTEAERLRMLRDALATAREISFEGRRAKILVELAPHLSDRLLYEALAAAWEIEDEWFRAEALVGLLPRLAEQGYREEALLAAQELPKGDEYGIDSPRAGALAALAPYLPEPLLRDALAAARDIWGEYGRAKALVGLLPRLAELGYPGEALRAALGIGHDGRRAKALARLIPHLREVERLQALRGSLAVTRRMANRDSLVETLAVLAPHLPEVERLRVLRQALARTRGDLRRSAWLKVLAPHLPETLLLEELAALWRIGDIGLRAEALAALAPHLPGPLLREALAAAQEIGDKRLQSDALAGLAPHLPDVERLQALRKALAATRKLAAPQVMSDRSGPVMIVSGRWLVEVLVGLVPHLPDVERSQVLQEALAALWQIRGVIPRVEALKALAPHLPETLLREALATARKSKDDWFRADALAALAPHLPEPLLREALAAAREIEDQGFRAEALKGLACHLPELLRQEELKRVRKIGDKCNRAQLLAALATYLPEPLLREALAAVREMRDRDKARAMAWLISRLAELGYPDHALAAVHEIEDEFWQAKALAGLAPHLQEGERLRALRGALAAVKKTKGWTRTSALIALAPYLPEPLLLEALTAALEIGRKWQRPVSFTATFEMYTGLGSTEEARAEALAALAPYLPEPLLLEALTAALEIADAVGRAKALTALGFRLAKLPYATLTPLWQEVLSSRIRVIRSDLLSDLRTLAPVIAKLGGEEAVAETFRAIQDIGRWWP